MSILRAFKSLINSNPLGPFSVRSTITMSAGSDSNSRKASAMLSVSPDTVIERANAADTSVYVVTMPSFTHLLASAQMTPLPTPLDVSGLVDKTGGRSIYANEKDLGPLFRAIAEEVASAYVLGFYPPQGNRNDGKFHQIRIEGPAGLVLRQSRPGYQAGKQ